MVKRLAYIPVLTKGWNKPGWKPLKKGIYDSSRRIFVLKTFCEGKIFIASSNIKKEKLMNEAPAFRYSFRYITKLTIE